MQSRRVIEIAGQHEVPGLPPDFPSCVYERSDGSSFRRAHIIGRRIFDPAAPIPDVTPSPERNLFLKDVVEAVQQAADETGIALS